MWLVSHEPDDSGDWGGRAVSKLEGVTCLSVSPSGTANGHRGLAPATITFWVPSASVSPKLPAQTSRLGHQHTESRRNKHERCAPRFMGLFTTALFIIAEKREVKRLTHRLDV